MTEDLLSTAAVRRTYMYLCGFIVMWGGYNSGLLLMEQTRKLRSATTVYVAQVVEPATPEPTPSPVPPIVLEDGIAIPATCGKYFDASFPIDLKRVADFHLQSAVQRDWKTRPFTRSEIMRHPCNEEVEKEMSTMILLKNNTLYYHISTPVEELKFPIRVGFLARHFETLREAFSSSEKLPDMLFKWWSIDNPVVGAGCSKKGNVFGTVSYSHCPRPYCSMSLTIPVSHSPESKEGRIYLDKTAMNWKNCTTRKFRFRDATGEWHGSATGHIPMNFWDSPNPDFHPPCTLAISANNECNATMGNTDWDPSFASGPNTEKTMRQTFMDMFADSDTVIANNDKKDMCEMFQKNRILFSIAGGSYASNLIDNFYSGALVLKQNYPSWSFLEPYFEPNKHYLLVRRDLKDVKVLSDKLLALTEEDEEFKQIMRIAKAGRDRALLVARESPLMNQCFYMYLFRRYAEMLDRKATDFDPNEWIRLEEAHWRSPR